MRKRRFFGTLIFAVPVVVAAATFAVAGDAGKSQFKADTRTGYPEVAGPGTISTIGSGTFEASLNGAGNEISYTLTYSDLEGGAVTQAPSASGPVASAAASSPFSAVVRSRPARSP